MTLLPPMLDGLPVVKKLVLWSLLLSSPGAGKVGSLRLKLMATLERRRSPLPIRGEPRVLLVDEFRREISAAFIVAAAAREIEEERGEGVSRRWR
jgi:hypothetical protein